MEKKIIGHCGVDSGQLLIVDPCYLEEWKNGNYGEKEDNHYNDCTNTTLSKQMGGEILVAGVRGTGVAISTGYGDGNYPVEAVYEDDRIKEIHIKFF